MAAFFENELGRIYVSDPIIKQVILPEIIASKRFRPLGMQTEMDAVEFPLPKSLEKSIRLAANEGRLEATVSVSVEFGTSIVDEAAKLKRRIRQAVESTTGLKVDELSLSVEKVHGVDATPVHVQPKAQPESGMTADEA